MASHSPIPQTVFLNVLYDREYERLFVALIAGLTGMGMIPRCVLQIPEDGSGRLRRIFKWLSGCDASIHDLSRQFGRHNMPFELGLACALRLQGRRHKFLVLETKKFRLQKTLSDLNGQDPKIHNGNSSQLVACVFDWSGRPPPVPEPLKQLQSLNSMLWDVAKDLKRQRPVDDSSIFHRRDFEKLVSSAIEIATGLGLLS